MVCAAGNMRLPERVKQGRPEACALTGPQRVPAHRYISKVHVVLCMACVCALHPRTCLRSVETLT